MTSFSTVLFATFVAVVIIQVINRLAGVIASIVWTIGLSGYGFYILQGGAKVEFIGLQVEPWHLAAFTAVLLAYNTWVLVRVLKSGSSR